MARIVLTGATSGIGLAAAKRLATAGHDLVLHGPEPEARAADAIETVRRVARTSNVEYLAADFRQRGGARALADAILADGRPVDVLVDNAAIPGPRTRTIGWSGAELAYDVNFLAGVDLVAALLPAIPENGRIVNVASATHFGADLDLDDLDFQRRRYDPSEAYAQSKLAIVTYSNWLAAHVAPRVLSIHPGVVSTELLHSMFAIDGIPVDVGGEHLAAAVTVDAPDGSYLDETRPAPPSAASLDPRLQERLVADAEERLGIRLP